MTSTTRPLPAAIETKLLEFLAGGKTGSLTLEILNGRVNAYRLTESGRVDARASDAGRTSRVDTPSP